MRVNLKYNIMTYIVVKDENGNVTYQGKPENRPVEERPGFWQRLGRQILRTANNDEETQGSFRFKQTVNEANNASTPEDRNRIYKNAAKQRLAETATAFMAPAIGADIVASGFVPAAIKFGTGAVTGAMGGYAGNVVGKELDKDLGTTFIEPALSFAGGLAGGIKGYNLASKAAPVQIMTYKHMTPKVFGEISPEAIAAKTKVK